MISETTQQRRQAYSLPTDWLAYVCLSGNGFFAVAVLALRLLQPERSPLNEAVSFYVHGAQMIMVSLIVFFASLLPISDSLSPPMLFGLTERMLLAVYAAWLCAAAIGLLRSTADPAH
jgi:hypothetical protein